MVGPSTAKFSYESFTIDSGYLSDLVDSAQRRHDDDTVLFASSSVSNSTDFLRSIFDDTEWDKPVRGKAKAAALNKRCRDFAARVKKPTRFPIIPLASTLARAAAEATELNIVNRRRKPSREYRRSRPQRTMREAVVDRCGRTRAASKILNTVTTSGVEDSSAVLQSSSGDVSRSK